jgi:RecA-family ATPase
MRSGGAAMKADLGNVFRREDGTMGQKPAEPAEKIPLKFFSEVKTPAPKRWLIKNVMAMGETSTWIAPPGGGKSALLTDIARHLAEGLMWRGHRTKAKCSVAYFALERADLVARRLSAYARRDGIGDLPIALAGQIINLMSPGCVDLILEAIMDIQEHYKAGVGLAIFDTYSKGIAAGGGDENSAKDQNIALANFRQVIDRTGIHIATVGHTGKDVSKGERGSNAKLADVDLEVQIAKTSRPRPSPRPTISRSDL